MAEAVLQMDVLRSYLLRRRQVLLMELGEIEDVLGLERTKPPKHKDKPAPKATAGADKQG